MSHLDDNIRSWHYTYMHHRVWWHLKGDGTSCRIQLNHCNLLCCTQFRCFCHERQLISRRILRRAQLFPLCHWIGMVGINTVAEDIVSQLLWETKFRMNESQCDILQRLLHV